MADRLVGDAADAVDDLAGQSRRGLSLDDHDAVITDDHAGIGITLGREGIEPVTHLGERDLFSVMSPCDANALAISRSFLLVASATNIFSLHLQ